ncbi:sm domain-containing protein [Trichonephila clavata]|uniref:Sm domain-containing protein n=1 Tax=Trichonephila clavata TaxID=2740835 RepID=A0A8X6KJG3_TRICU|nr:sm domain-containing protein [Trichonephila clavata]
MSSRERAISSRTLVCLLQGLAGKVVHIDLRDETTITGKVVYVDGFMNVEMSNVDYQAPSGEVKKYEEYLCLGKYISTSFLIIVDIRTATIWSRNKFPEPVDSFGAWFMSICWHGSHFNSKFLKLGSPLAPFSLTVRDITDGLTCASRLCQNSNFLSISTDASKVILFRGPRTLG